MDKVKTVKGELVERSLCKKIGDQFYKVGNTKIKDSGDCYLINDKYIRYDTGFIEYCHITGSYVRKTQFPLLYGVVDIKGKDLVYGYFKHDLTKVFNINLGSETVACICDEIVKILDLKYYPRGGAYYPRKIVSSNIDQAYKGSYVSFNTGNYSLDNNSIALIQQHYQKREGNELTKFMPYSIGIEYETSGGHLPEHLCYRYALVPLRDGSISGHEYVTIPMQPDEISLIGEQCEVLTNHCIVDRLCSVHNHMGGYSKEPIKVLALYELCRRLQEDIFNILPPFKRDSRFFANKKEGKDHSQLLPNLDINIYKEDETFSIDHCFNRLLSFLNEGQLPQKREGRYIHSREENNKWDQKRRYYWVNFIPLFFHDKATVEFRAHHGTLNKDKVYNWIWITNAFMRYADAYPELILRKKIKITLNDVLLGYVDDFGKGEGNKEIADQLIKYTAARYQTFFKHLMHDDIYCDKEFSNDRNFKWEITGIKATDSSEKSQDSGEIWDFEEQEQPEPIIDFLIPAK